MTMGRSLGGGLAPVGGGVRRDIVECAGGVVGDLADVLLRQACT